MQHGDPQSISADDGFGTHLEECVGCAKWFDAWDALEDEAFTEFLIGLVELRPCPTGRAELLLKRVNRMMSSPEKSN